MTVANYAMKLEREVWGILDGPWGSDTWMGWRRDWAQRVTSLAFLPFPAAGSLVVLPFNSWGFVPLCSHITVRPCKPLTAL